MPSVVTETMPRSRNTDVAVSRAWRGSRPGVAIRPAISGGPDTPAMPCATPAQTPTTMSRDGVIVRISRRPATMIPIDSNRMLASATRIAGSGNHCISARPGTMPTTPPAQMRASSRQSSSRYSPATIGSVLNVWNSTAIATACAGDHTSDSSGTATREKPSPDTARTSVPENTIAVVAASGIQLVLVIGPFAQDRFDACGRLQ
ncbi:hypothetical protein D3C87_1203650 [compost metagenome]